jgi:hypothetical protein
LDLFKRHPAEVASGPTHRNDLAIILKNNRGGHI